MEDVTFNAPGKGPWELEATHYSRPLSRFVGPAVMEAFPKGFAEGAARYGLLLDHLEPALVNGFVYTQPAAYLAPKGAMGPPPAPILWLLTRLHPKMRARIATSARAFEAKQWRADLETWDSQDKPAAVEAHRALAIIDVGSLSDDALSAHLQDCYEHATRMVELHHKYTATTIVITGDLLAQVVPWTGATPGEVCALLQGTSPISNGFAADELVKAGDAIAASENARAILDSVAPAADKLQALTLDPDVGPAVRPYVETVQHRSVGYDVGDLTAGEMPDVMVQTLATAARGAVPKAAEGGTVERLRSKVPAEHLAEFDALAGRGADDEPSARRARRLLGRLGHRPRPAGPAGGRPPLARARAAARPRPRGRPPDRRARCAAPWRRRAQPGGGGEAPRVADDSDHHRRPTVPQRDARRAAPGKHPAAGRPTRRACGGRDADRTVRGLRDAELRHGAARAAGQRRRLRRHRPGDRRLGRLRPGAAR